MANTFLTPSVIARLALRALVNNLVMAGLVYRDYDREFARAGDTITIRDPAAFTAKDFPTEGLVIQNATEGSTAVTLDRWKDVSFQVTSKEMALSIEDFTEQLLQPAVRALAQQIDGDLCALYADVPYHVGTAGATPDGLDDLANTRKALVDKGVPTDQLRLVLDPAAEAKLLQLDALVGAEKSGSTAALRRANLGTIFGLGLFMDQNVKQHTTGGDDCAIDNGAGYDAGETAIHVDGLAGRPVAGDLLSLGGYDYTVVSATALAGTDSDLVIAPGLQAAAANDDAITVVASHRANLGFHRDAFCLVTRPLVPPQSGIKCEALSWRGVSVRVVYDWDRTAKADVISLDVLYGVKTLNAKMAVRLLG